MGLASCSSQGIDQGFREVVRAPEYLDGGVLSNNGGCTTAGGKILVFFEAEDGPFFCAVLLFRRGEPHAVTYDLAGFEGYGFIQARGGPSCESLEAADGTLNNQPSIPIDEIWGGLDAGFVYENRILTYFVGEGAGLRAGRYLYSIPAEHYGSNSPCRYP